MSHNPSGAATARTIESVDDLRSDLAGRFKVTASSGDAIAPAVVDADLVAVERDGFIIVEDLITAAICEEIKEAVQPLLSKSGRNSFEGQRTQRLYNVLTKTRVCDVLVEHPRVLALLDRLLMPNYLLSQLQVININPGEQAQLLHYDDGMYPIPRPRPPLSAATIWAIDAFTEGNGATVVLPGSHQWNSQRRATDQDHRVSVTMPPGSCVFFVGTLWHGGGANLSGQSRLAVTAQYCEPWLRTQEAFTLSTPRDTVNAVSEDLRRMLGYSIHPPFVGMVDGMHPKRLLDIAPRS
ncbi:phytanoyl-CoA dioxygenase family protein [Mycobacterium deserti]|uniref:Phytanoyl-CoA dioxygenase family protein n=1 Tax=Mycobacterium deserti TaxID=2978347 RepID=A0ABT2MH78_9MYCO|nr:phytanoyl-CoA dioxygenase family protein [Mycobacterium deserti]MCT7660879.1 phytanoyl-CoA dioxygenase family protein [Mycobacterium deserti]